MADSTSAEEDFAAHARRCIDAKAKPPGSLGLLEEWAVQLAALQETLTPRLVAARLVVFAADHGITLSNPGVSAYPRGVSAAIFRTIAAGKAASATLCKANDCSLDVIDVGLDLPTPAAEPTTGGAVQCTLSSIRKGSRDMLAGPAMTAEESEAAQAAGRAAVRRYLAERPEESPATMALCVGELGIGNTTPAAAIVAALTAKAPIDVCGKGTGLTEEAVQAKAATIQRALDISASLVQSGDPALVLQAVGGLELAAMVGAYIEAAAARVPVVVDGFLAGAAALVALHMDPSIARSLFWSHRSDEKGTQTLLDAVSAITGRSTQPALSMGLRLGEGTGAVLALPLLRSACALMFMATLEESLAAPAEESASNGH